MKYLFLAFFLLSSVALTADPKVPEVAPREDRAEFVYESDDLFESQLLNIIKEMGIYFTDNAIGGEEGLHYEFQLDNLADDPDMETIIKKILLEDDRNGEHPTIEVERTGKVVK